jgi:ubiquinone/menaquinone biosynthesis C-methylase UbiE
MTMPARFDRVAGVYRWLECLSFGPYLARCRNLRLEEMLGARSALLLGDGDGRFVARLATAAPQMVITAVDASSTMLRHTARRLARCAAEARVTLTRANALEYVPQQTYELLVSHFFLDCFRDAEVARLLEQLQPAARPGTVWVISEFAVPAGPWTGRLGRLIIAALYIAFGLLTGLEPRHLPDYAAALQGAGWRMEDRSPLLCGLLVSERWRFAGSAPE